MKIQHYNTLNRNSNSIASLWATRILDLLLKKQCEYLFTKTERERERELVSKRLRANLVYQYLNGVSFASMCV